MVEDTNQGYVTCNRKFTYLGSVITHDLDDPASRSVHGSARPAPILHSLINFWRCKGLTVQMKKSFYIPTIVNILLWGCESLTIRKDDLHRLEVFHHSSP
jgi:hypothetical protein